MKIIVNENIHFIKAFETGSLPSLVVITGANGSGKSLLLREIYKSRDFPMVESRSYVFEDDKRVAKIGFLDNIISLNFKTTTSIEHLGFPWVNLQLIYPCYVDLKKTGEKITEESLEKKIVRRYPLNLIQNVDGIIFSELVHTLEGTYNNRKDDSGLATQEELITNMRGSTNPFEFDFAFLCLQHFLRQKAGNNEIASPIELFNSISEASGFEYQIQSEFNPLDDSVRIRFLNKNTNDFLNDFESFSSGEQALFRLLVAAFNSNSDKFPDLILLDEPDAFLHPSLAAKMLKVIQQVFIKQNNCKVILTTHSPTTVAMTDDLSIYKMDIKTGKLLKGDKSEAIKSLMSGLKSISLYYNETKQVFVEGREDVMFLSEIYSRLAKDDTYGLNGSLRFLTLEKKGERNEAISGGKNQLRNFVNEVARSGNKSIIGLVDYDLKEQSNDSISVLGRQNRYGLENYIFDPMFLIALIVDLEPTEKNGIGFGQEDEIVTFSDLSISERQIIIDKLIIKYNIPNSPNATYTNILGEKVSIPSFFITQECHPLEKEIRNKIYPLQKHADDLKKKMLKIVKCFPTLLPIEILDTFKELEGKGG